MEQQAPPGGTPRRPPPPVARPNPVEEPPALGRRLTQRRTILSFVIGFGLLIIAFQRLNVDLPATWATIRQANPLLYLAGLAAFYLSFVFRTLRWRVLLHNVGFGAQEGVRLPGTARLGEILLMSWFVNCLVPAKLGDAYRAYLLKRAAGVSFSKTFGTVLAERILDLVVLFGLLGISALLTFGSSLPLAVLALVELALGLAVLLILGLVAMRLFGQRIRHWIPHRLRGKYGLFEEGTLHSFQGLPLLVLFTMLVWVLEAERLYLVMRALGIENMHPAVPLFLSLAAALLTTIPVTPAGLGFVESGLVGLVLLLGSLGLIEDVSRETAVSLALLDRTISYWSVIVVGGILHFWHERH